jgi:hypothetical protein
MESGGQGLLEGERTDGWPKVLTSMGEAWVWLQQHPVELSTPLLLSSLGGWVFFAVLRLLPAHATAITLLLSGLVLLFLTSYLAVVVVSKKLLNMMDEAPVREESVLESVMRMPDLWTVLWRLLWHSVKLLPAVFFISVAAVVLLETGFKLIEHGEINPAQRQQFHYIGTQIALIVETVGMARYTFAIPFMVLGEIDAKKALRRSREAVGAIGWRIEGLSALEYVLVGLLPSLLLRWTGQTPSAAHPVPLGIEGVIDVARAVGSTWFVLGIALIAKDVQKQAGLPMA